MNVIWKGTLTKMRAEHTEPVRYYLQDGFWDASRAVDELPMNDWIGTHVELRFEGEIQCVYCGRVSKKSFGQGFCYPCFRARAESDVCIVKPELCHHGNPDDPCRDEEFAQSQCFQPHVLYASLTSGVKVGITRRPNVPSRWIDQGAVAAVPLAVLPSRREVGLLEHRLSESFQDKTHWMRMLKNEHPDGDLDAGVATLLDRMTEWGIEGVLPPEERVRHSFVYPVDVWPEKVKSFNLDKAPVAGGRLNGIKGQYLIFDTGVINVRKFTGYVVSVSATPADG
jgi:hypothetical protein